MTVSQGNIYGASLWDQSEGWKEKRTKEKHRGEKKRMTDSHKHTYWEVTRRNQIYKGKSKDEWLGERELAKAATLVQIASLCVGKATFLPPDTFFLCVPGKRPQSSHSM